MDELEKDSTRPYKRHILDGAFDPIPSEVQAAAFRVAKRFSESASLGKLVAMLGLTETADELV